MKQGKQKILKSIAFISFFCVVIFLLNTLIIHFTNPSIDPFKFPVSYYVLTSDGWVMKMGFFMISIAEMLLAINLFLHDRYQNQWASLFLFVAGIAVLFVSVFNMDPEGSLTLKGRIHIYMAALHFALFILAVFLFAFNHPKNKLRNYSFFTGYMTLVLYVSMLFILRNEDSVIFNYYGLIQKLDILFIITWLGVIAMKQLKN